MYTYGTDNLILPGNLAVEVISPKKYSCRSEPVEKLVSQNPAFMEWKEEEGSCLVIVNDANRPTPTAEIIASDEEFFCRPDVGYIVATGAHRAPEGSEWKQVFGRLYDRVKDRIIVHDARNENELVYLGRTSFGTDVRLNRVIDRYSRLLVIGSVEPHYFAGFTGGRKAFLPGIAGYKTITDNHRLALEPGSGLLELDGNPVHEDMAEAAAMLAGRDIFSIMTVLDQRQEVFSLHTGELDTAFNACVGDANYLLSVEVSGGADIIITYAVSPLNRDLYQAHKAIENVRDALRPGGIIILVSECADGESVSLIFMIC